MNKNKITDEAEAVRTAVREGYAKIADRTLNAASCGTGVSVAVPLQPTPEQLARADRLFRRRTGGFARGREHGPLLRQSRCARRAEAGRNRPGPWQRRRIRCVHRRAQSWSDRPRHRRGHDAGDAGQSAREHKAPYREQSGLDNVEFRLGEIEHLPVADASVDAIISNCVINLSPDKPQVGARWRAC